MGTTSCTLLKLPVLLHSFKKNALKISIKLLVFMRNWATRNTSRQAAWRLSLQHRSPEAPKPRNRCGSLLLTVPSGGGAAARAWLPRGSGRFRVAEVTPVPSTVSLTLIFVCNLYLGPGIWRPSFQTAQALASTASPRAVSFNGRYPSQAPSDLASDCRGRNEKPYVPPWAAPRHRNNISKNSQNNL